MPRPQRYGAVAIALHWLIAAGILGQIALGLAMTRDGIPLTQQFQLYQLHKSIGVTVLLTVSLRLAWRLKHRPPELPRGVPARERAAAHVTHLMLYILMFGLPLTGWAMVSASIFNIPTVLYGVVPWPHLPVLSTLADKPPVEAALKAVHTWLGWVLMVGVGLHVAAALRHVLRRDGLIGRMLPLAGKA